MILAALPWLSISTTICLWLLVVISVLLVMVIMLQRPKQEGLGAAFGSGVTDQVFGARTTDVLQKITRNLGFMLFVLCIVVSVLKMKSNKTVSLANPVAEKTKVEPAKPAEPEKAESLTKELPIAPATSEPSKDAQSSSIEPAVPAAPNMDATAPKPVDPTPAAPSAEKPNE